MTTFIIAKDGTRLMPTTNVKKVRKLLKTKRAVIHTYRPFTIQLLYESEKNVQPVEFAQDAGYQHVGISIKSDKHEYISAQYDLLPDEVERHNDCRKYRRTRRNRLRYRAPRFDNRGIPEGWLAPSLEHKKQLHVQIFEMYNAVVPISKVTVEVAQFDTQLLKAIESGAPLPEGEDYQHGERYAYDTLREAVFARDEYTCLCCGKNVFKDGIILRIHHLGYRQNDRTNRLSNLASVCTGCHTSKNHQPGGRLYDWKPKLKNFKGAAFMNAVKYQIYEAFKSKHDNVSITFGAVTKRTRIDRNIAKSHANDAYCIGIFRPKHRAVTQVFAKKRRNNRILEKFYDAKYIDIRDGKTKKGSALSCGRTNRSIPRNNPLNERIYRGEKKVQGRRAIRTQRYPVQPHDIIFYAKKKCVSKGMQHNGTRVVLDNSKSIKVQQAKIIRHTGGWVVQKEKIKKEVKDTEVCV